MAIIPGKWEVFRRDSGVTVVQSTHEGEDYMVARCYGDGEGDEVSTARLIAAAPELLAACQEAVSAITYLLSNDDDDPNYADTLNTLAAVIAKAEGRG